MQPQSDILMLSYMGLVRALAWKIHQKLPRHVELDDLFGYGCVGLAEAANAHYDRLLLDLINSNPTAFDGVAMYHASHANLVSGGGSARCHAIGRAGA